MSRGLGDVYKRQLLLLSALEVSEAWESVASCELEELEESESEGA